jgi:hypothetical protein
MLLPQFVDGAGRGRLDYQVPGCHSPSRSLVEFLIRHAAEEKFRENGGAKGRTTGLPQELHDFVRRPGDRHGPDGGENPVNAGLDGGERGVRRLKVLSVEPGEVPLRRGNHHGELHQVGLLAGRVPLQLPAAHLILLPMGGVARGLPRDRLLRQVERAREGGNVA